MTRDHHRARPRPGSLRGTATEQAVRTVEGLRRRCGDVVALDGVVMPVGILVLFNLLRGSQANQGEPPWSPPSARTA
ncbi:hypothetical protein [Actinosynnema sp.]|uniref:hypothetical protein n=1 Tax=Actinosynnema sp. TaxID=1872144 RepID=UPI003F84405E